MRLVATAIGPNSGPPNWGQCQDAPKPNPLANDCWSFGVLTGYTQRVITMSLYYTHLLIPFSPKYRPEPEVVAAFAQGMIKNGNVANPFTISFSRVAKKEPYFREIRNVATG